MRLRGAALRPPRRTRPRRGALQGPLPVSPGRAFDWGNRGPTRAEFPRQPYSSELHLPTNQPPRPDPDPPPLLSMRGAPTRRPPAAGHAQCARTPPTHRWACAARPAPGLPRPGPRRGACAVPSGPDVSASERGGLRGGGAGYLPVEDAEPAQLLQADRAGGLRAVGQPRVVGRLVHVPGLHHGGAGGAATGPRPAPGGSEPRPAPGAFAGAAPPRSPRPRERPPERREAFVPRGGAGRAAAGRAQAPGGGPPSRRRRARAQGGCPRGLPVGSAQAWGPHGAEPERGALSPATASQLVIWEAEGDLESARPGPR